MIPAGTNVEDHQFAYIRESLKPYYEEIKAAEDPQVQLAYAMFHVVKNYMNNLVTEIPGVQISLIGGI